MVPWNWTYRQIQNVKFIIWLLITNLPHVFYLNMFKKVPKVKLRIKTLELIVFWCTWGHTFFIFDLDPISLQNSSFHTLGRSIWYPINKGLYLTYFLKLRHPESPCPTLPLTHVSTTLNFVLQPSSIHLLC